MGLKLGTTIPWLRYVALMAAMFGSLAVADVLVGWWLGWIIAAPLGAFAVSSHDRR